MYLAYDVYPHAWLWVFDLGHVGPVFDIEYPVKRLALWEQIRLDAFVEGTAYFQTLDS